MRLLGQVINFVFLGLSVISLSCNRPNQQVEIENQLKRLIEADNNEDIKVIVSLYDKDAVLMPPSGEEIVGLEAIREHYTNLFEQFDFLNLGFKTHETIIIDNWAVNIGTTEGVISAFHNHSTKQINDKYIMLFKKSEAKEWKINRLIWNKNPKLNDGL